MRTVSIALLTLATVGLTGCLSQRLPNAYDLVAREYRDGSGSRCEQCAYESGPTRYATERPITGQAFAASRANAAAERAFVRCQSGRLN